MRFTTLLLVIGLTAPSAFASDPPFGTHRFEDYPARVYQGQFAKPDFVHGRQYRFYRTRLREGSRAGVNFGGLYSIVTIGCGTDCASYYAVDLRSGKISRFPIGGEYNDEAHQEPIVLAPYLTGQKNSRLLKAWWVYRQKDGASICRQGEFLFDGKLFRQIWQNEMSGDCPQDVDHRFPQPSEK